MKMRVLVFLGAVLCGGLVRADGDAAAIEREVLSAERDCERLQAKLKDRCSLTDYAAQAVSVGGTNLWAKALQAALQEHEIVRIPPRREPYFLEETVVLPSNRRIEAAGATVALAPGVTTVMLRTAAAQDGTLRPIAPGRRGDNIAIVGGRWEDNCVERLGFGETGLFNLLPRKLGNFYGVSAFFYLGNADHVTVKDVTFVRCGAFAVQAGDGDGFVFSRIRFDDCFADGLHLNGNVSRVHAKDVRGKVGDDLVALNAYDWLHCSVNFGPQRYVLCEDLELIPKDGKGYPAIRILPAKFRYADGSKVDCAVSDVIFRRVRGIRTFKMYLQTAQYDIGTEPEWAEVGSGGNIFFEDIDIDLTAPIDLLGGYATSDPLRGHYGAFEFGANLTSVTIRNVRIRFHLDDYPLGHLATVGPKSACYPARDGRPAREIFNPYVSSRVGKLTVEGLTVEGRAPEQLIYPVTFSDINGDGRSTGSGTIGEVDFRDGRAASAAVALRADDSAAIADLVEKACRPDGGRKVTIGRNPNSADGTWTITRPVVLPSNFTLELDGAHLVLGTGTFCNMFRADGVTNVTLVGRNGAVADGGVYNGLHEKNAGKEGRPPITVNNTLLFTRVKHFRVEGIRFVKQRWWALNFIACSHGVIRKLDFLSDHTSIDENGRLLDTVSGSAYHQIVVKNSDGVDLRAGCHDILVEDITGFVEDDMVALTCLTGGFEREFLAPDEPYEISDVTVRNVRGAAMCSLVRLLAQGGGRVRRVLVDGVEDVSVDGLYLRGRGGLGVNIGDAHLYQKPQCRPENMDEIVVRNVRSRARYGVRIRGGAGRVNVSNVVGFDDCPNPFSDERIPAGE